MILPNTSFCVFFSERMHSSFLSVKYISDVKRVTDLHQSIFMRWFPLTFGLFYTIKLFALVKGTSIGYAQKDREREKERAELTHANANANANSNVNISTKSDENIILNSKWCVLLLICIQSRRKRIVWKIAMRCICRAFCENETAGDSLALNCN